MNFLEKNDTIALNKNPTVKIWQIVKKRLHSLLNAAFFYVIIIRQDFTNLDAILKRWEVVSMMNWDLTVLTVKNSSWILVLLSYLLPTSWILLVGFFILVVFFKQILRIIKELSKILLRKIFFIKIYSNPFKIQLIEII